MANYKDPELKATETVTFRFTLSEKLMLDRLAKTENKSKTDVLRDLIAARAEDLSLSDLPPEPPAPRPGRPKKSAPEKSASESIMEALEVTEVPEVVEVAEPPARTVTTQADDLHQISEPSEPRIALGDLVTQFREHFSDRAEGTRKELDETIRFFFNDLHEGETFLNKKMPLNDIDSQQLIEIREKMIRSNLRLAKMNLYLTYLRMMLHFAVKQLSFNFGFNPSDFLRPFTVSEIPKSWPGRRF